MFLRCSKRNKDGKLHRYWSVVENRRVGRKVHQRQVLYLGEINDSEREAWCRAISVFDEDSSEEQQLKLYPSDRDIPAHAEQQGVRIKLDQMTLHHPRRWGDCWLALTLWDQLELDTFWKSRLGVSREGTDWLKVLKLLTVYRLLDPGSEWRLHRDWYEQCALGDLLDADFAIAAKDTLYRCHDLVLDHKEDFFSHLNNRWRDLFNVDYEVLLYDLTSTYFESSGPFEEGDKRRYGYSRDKRSDCVQVVIALVVSTEGLPLAYEVMPGNTLDNQTLRLFVDKIHERYGKAKRVWLMDRGIPTEDTLEWLRASDPPVQYLVGTPKGRLSRLQTQLAECEWTEAREGVDVKLLPMSGEVYVLARSRDRVHKERSMRNRRLRKYLKALRRLRLERKRTPTRDELLKAIGAAGKDAGRDAGVVMIELPEEGEAVSPETFRYRVDRKKLRLLREREGNYLLRTNQQKVDPATLWEQYMQLVQIEAVFRTLKSDLGLRPIWHQLEHRIEAHIFISFQAYCLQVTLQRRLKALAPGLTARAVLEKMQRLQMVDVRFPTTDGRTLTLPRRTEPDKDQRLLLDQLKLTLPPQPKPRITGETKKVM
jgi:transposase